MSFKFKYSGFKEMIKELNLRSGKVRYAQGELRKVGEAEVAAAQNRIKSTKQSPDGDQWVAWSAATALSRERAGTAQLGLLYNTGTLFNSFRIDINTNQVVISNTAPYATFLQEGTDKMPARPYFGWSNESKDRISEIFEVYLKRVIIEGKG